MYDELLFSVDGDKAVKIERQSLPALDLWERTHLQEWVLANPEILGPGTVVVTSEFDRWQAYDGAPVADRLDWTRAAGSWSPSSSATQPRRRSTCKRSTMRPWSAA